MRCAVRLRERKVPNGHFHPTLIIAGIVCRGLSMILARTVLKHDSSWLSVESWHQDLRHFETCDRLHIPNEHIQTP